MWLLEHISSKLADHYIIGFTDNDKTMATALEDTLELQQLGKTLEKSILNMKRLEILRAIQSKNFLATKTQKLFGLTLADSSKTAFDKVTC